MDSLEVTTMPCRRLVLEQGVEGVHPDVRVGPASETFWRFSFEKVAKSTSVHSLATLIAQAYVASVESGNIPAGRLVSRAKLHHPYIGPINDLLPACKYSPPKEVVLFDSGVVDGGIIGHAIDLYASEGFTVQGVFSIIGLRRAPMGKQTVAEAASRRRIPSFTLLPKQDLVFRLLAFEKHKEYLDIVDPRHSFTLKNSKYCALRAGGDIAAALPPVALYVPR